MIVLLILTWIFKVNGWNIPVWVWMAEVGAIAAKMMLDVLATNARDPEARKRRYYGERDEDELDD